MLPGGFFDLLLRICSEDVCVRPTVALSISGIIHQQRSKDKWFFYILRVTVDSSISSIRTFPIFNRRRNPLFS